MTSKKFNLILLLLVAIFTIISCSKEDNYKFPPQVLNVPNYNNQQEDVFSTLATDINNQGMIVGFTGGSNTPLSRIYELPSTGFMIQKDNSNAVRISPDTIYETWPMAINNQGLIVGAYLPPSFGNFSESEMVELPAYAFTYTIQDGKFTTIHQNQFKFSVATCVNDDGIIGGYCGKSLAYRAPAYACILNYPDSSSFVILHPDSAYSSEVKAINKNYCVISAEYNREFNSTSISIINLSDLSVVGKIPLDEFSYFSADIGDINSNDEIVGWILNANDALTETGFIYKPGDIKVNKFEINTEVNGWNYLSIRFVDINDNGRIAAIAGRSIGAGGLYQNRAAIINTDFTGFTDVTPENSDTYGEAYAINNNSDVVGYAGFMQKHALVINRAFVATGN